MSVPVPFNATVRGEFGAESAKLKVAFLAPSAAALNVTFAVQVAPFATVAQLWLTV